MRALLAFSLAYAGKDSLRPQWPEWINGEIDPDFMWLYHTEWEGKSSKVMFLPNANVEATIPGCKNNPGACVWAVKDGVEESQKAEIMAQAQMLQMDALRQVELVSTEVAKTGQKSKLSFSKLLFDPEEEKLD